MSLTPDVLGSIQNGDQLEINAEAEITTDCLFPSSECVGEPYNFNPKIGARIVVSTSTTSAAGFEVVPRQEVNCRQKTPNRQHHCVFTMQPGAAPGRPRHARLPVERLLREPRDGRVAQARQPQAQRDPDRRQQQERQDQAGQGPPERGPHAAGHPAGDPAAPAARDLHDRKQRADDERALAQPRGRGGDLLGRAGQPHRGRAALRARGPDDRRRAAQPQRQRLDAHRPGRQPHRDRPGHARPAGRRPQGRDHREQRLQLHEEGDAVRLEQGRRPRDQEERHGPPVGERRAQHLGLRPRRPRHVPPDPAHRRDRGDALSRPVRRRREAA